MKSRPKLGVALAVTAVALLQPPAPAHALDIYEIHGTATDALGRALSAVTVSDGSKQVSTDGTGAYSIMEGNTGRYTLTASRTDLATSSKSVTVNAVPLRYEQNFTLLYKIGGSLSKSSMSTANGAASATLTVTTHAPTPGVDGEAGKSCVRVRDSRTGQKKSATLASTAGALSTWTYALSVPQGSPEGSHSLTAVAEDCGGTTALTSSASASYVIDNTAPTIRRLLPHDHSTTVFTSQPLLANIRDAGGSGLNPGTIKFTITSESGQTSTVNGSYTSSTGWAKTGPQSLQLDTKYRLSVTASDYAGNSFTVAHRPFDQGGGFLVTSMLAALTQAEIPETPCRIEDRGALGYKTAVCDDVPLNYGPTTAQLNGSRSAAGAGFVNHTVSLESAVLKTTIAGTPVTTPAYQSGEARWAPRTHALRFNSSGTAAQTVAVLGRQAVIGTLEVPVPAAWTGETKLMMPPTNTAPTVIACSDPSPSGADVTCLPDPTASRMLVSLNVPSTDVGSVAAAQVGAAGGEIVAIYEKGYQAVMPFGAAASLASDGRVTGVSHMLLRTGATSSALAASAASRLLSGNLPGTFNDLKAAVPATPRQVQGIPGGHGAYHVDYLSGGDVVGYAIVSDTFDDHPVLRLSHGDLTSAAHKRKAEVESVSGKTVSSWEFRHINPLTEAARYTLDDGSIVDVGLNQGDTVTPERLGPFVSTADRPATRPDDALASQLAWNHAGGDVSLTPTTWPSNSDSTTVTVGNRKLTMVDGGETFPNYTWHRGCTPTAASMVEAYWSQRGYPSFMSSADYALAAADALDDDIDGSSPQSRALIGEIAYYMKTVGMSTYLHNIGPGIRDFERANGVYRQTVTVLHQHLNRARLERQFDVEQVPAVASFIDWLFEPYTYSMGYGSYAPETIDHSVALYGYYKQDGATYMLMHTDYRYDGPTLVPWNHKWKIGQFDYAKN